MPILNSSVNPSSLSENDVLSRVCWVGKESRRSVHYYHDNNKPCRWRRSIIQWTSLGTGFFQTKEKRSLVASGQAMLFEWNEPTSYGYPPECSEPYEFTAIIFSASQTLQPLFEDLRSQFGSVVQMIATHPAAILLEEIYQRHVHHRFRDPVEESEMILALFHAIYREQQTQSMAQDAIAHGHSLIRHQYRSAINLKSLADRCGVSQEHFIRAFHARYQVSPGAMLRGLRLQHARQMLASTLIPVQEIAADCGFASSNSFCRAYRKQFGQRPLDERGGSGP